MPQKRVDEHNNVRTHPSAKSKPLTSGDAKMVVVRESPHAKHSPNKNTTQWPPQSPFQALLSSPSGRRKWQDRRDDGRETSPSPVKRREDGGMSLDSDEEEDEDGEEDEEELKLKIQAMQAKLKLKRLQRSKKREGSEGNDGARSSSKAESRRSASPQKAVGARPRAQREDVEVPLSPTREKRPPKEQQSPARARLGLAPHREGQDVSLKRARDGTQVRHARGDARRSDSSTAASAGRPATSFSERLAQSRVDSQRRQEKQEKVERVRSKGFGLEDKGGNTGHSGRASRLNGDRATPRGVNMSEEKRPPSDHQTQSARNGLDTGAGLARSSSTRTSRPSERPRTNHIYNSRTQEQTNQSTDVDLDSDSSNPPPHESNNDSDTPPSYYDPFSDIHLTKRHIPHSDITRALSSMEIFTLPRLLKDVKAPHYDPPDIEGDYVVFGILASKSSPFDQKANHRTNDEKDPQEDAEKPRNKFMVFHLTDLKWELDLFLFGSAFDQFWKLTEGTLVAVLNPGIMPPKGSRDSGRFSLKLGSSEDCIMEVGIARDIGYCKSVKKDGQQCGTWIDKRHTEICEFHLNLLIDRERKTRMEVNTMWRGHGNVDNKPKSRSREQGGHDHLMDGKKHHPGKSFHREYGQLYSIPGGAAGGKSAASILDSEDMDALHGMSKEEASRKRIAASQRERDLAKKLGEMGRGVGAEYLRTKHTTTKTATSTESEEVRAGLFDKPSAASLGLLNKKADDQHLSPAKDRKRHFGLGAVSTTTGSEAMGWGGARNARLLLPKADRLGSPEKGQASLKPGTVRNRSEDGSMSSPSKKRARFALENKGIREPGRESLGMVDGDVKGGVVEEDDDLDIV